MMEVIVGLTLMFVAVFLLHLRFVNEELINQREFMRGVLDHVKHIAQTAQIYSKAKNVDEAVASQAYLEGEQKTLAEAADILEGEVTPKGKLVGFWGQDEKGHQKKYTFAMAPQPSVLAKIPKERLIYESSNR